MVAPTEKTALRFDAEIFIVSTLILYLELVRGGAALRRGAEQVDYVEIDPRICELGRELHPERPYDSPHVRVVLDDARAYFQRATGGCESLSFVTGIRMLAILVGLFYLIAILHRPVPVRR